MSDYEFYHRLIKDPCTGCPAYEYLGRCGTLNCEVENLYHFIYETLKWDEDYFLDCIYFTDYVLPKIWQEEDYLKKKFEEYISDYLNWEEDNY